MASWSSRRKFLYGGSLLIVVIAIIFAVFFSIFYKKPTCFDGIKNGGEQDIDCGGACVKLCQSAFLPAGIQWGGGKFEKVTDGLYNVASYIVNPNLNGSALNVPYKFSLFDNQGVLITERKGTVTIPAHRNVLAFESAVDVGKRIPAKVTFEFLQAPLWFKSHDALDGLVVSDKKYVEAGGHSSLEVMLQNKSLYSYRDILVSVVLYDINSNAIGFSRTRIDALPANGGKDTAPFTWPFERQGRVVTIETLSSIAPLHD